MDPHNLRPYTSALDPDLDPVFQYQDTWFYIINQSMRRGQVSRHLFRKIQWICQQIRSSNQSLDCPTVYRGLNAEQGTDYYRHLKVGDRLVDRGFLSTTLSENVAKSSFTSDAWMTIEWQHPIPVLYLEAEKEILTLPGCELECVQITTIPIAYQTCVNGQSQWIRYTQTHYRMKARHINHDVQVKDQIDTTFTGDWEDYEQYKQHLVHTIGLIPE